MTAVCKSGRYLSIESSLAGIRRMKTRMVPPYEDLDWRRRLRALLGPACLTPVGTRRLMI